MKQFFTSKLLVLVAVVLGWTAVNVQQAMAQSTVAYVYDPAYGAGWTKDTDPIYEALTQNYDVTDIDVSVADVADIESLASYDLVYASEAVSGTHVYGLALKNLVGKVPMLNQKSFYYTSGRWSWATGKNPSTTVATDGGVITFDVAPGYSSHALFNGITWGTGDSFDVFNSVAYVNQIQAYSDPTAVISGDDVLATVTGTAGTFSAIHIHKPTADEKNQYVLIPLASNDIKNLNTNGITLILNAANYLLATKKTLSPAATPVIALDQQTKTVSVTITSTTEDADIYYTTDGTAPTVSSTKYTAPFEISVASATVKAIATKSGYLNSAVASQDVTNTGYVPKNEMLFWTDFNVQPEAWGTTGDLFGSNGGTAEIQKGGMTVGSKGQRVNLQTTGPSSVVGNTSYGPATEADKGASRNAMSFLKNAASGYFHTNETYQAPFDVVLWWCGAKAASYTEKVTISVKSETDSDWREVGTLSTKSYKLVVKQSVSYEGTDEVYVKVTCASGNGANNNAMIFDMKIFGEGVDVVDTPVINLEDDGDEQNMTATITCASAGVIAIYYTLDGSEPTTASTLYNGTAFTVGAATRIKAIAVRSDYASGTVSSATGFAYVVPTQIESDAVDKVEVSRTYFNLNGIKISEPAQGLNIVKIQYEDGSVEVTKEMAK